MPTHKQTHVKMSVGETKQNELKQASKNMNLKVRESVLQTASVPSAEGKRKQPKRERTGEGKGKASRSLGEADYARNMLQ